jgi:HEAT repeat protein
MQAPVEPQALAISNDALTLIAYGVITLSAIVLVLSLIVIAHHIVTDRERRRNRERFEGASVLLAPHLVENDAKLEDVVARARSTSGDRAVALVLRRARYDLSGPVVERITRILEVMGEVRKLLDEMKSRREWRRAGAVRGLGECGGAMAREALITAAGDVSGEVRRAARDGLLSDGSPEAILAAIRSFISDLPRRSGWRRTFYARLAIVAPAQLTDLIRSGELAPPEEKLAIEALGDAGRPVALSLAVERIGSTEPEMRATAVRVIGKVATDREVPLILEALDDAEWFVRAAAARSIEWMLTLNITTAQNGWRHIACEKLVGRLADNSWWVRANAARALSRAGNAGVNILLTATESTDRYARDAAIAALAMAPLTGEVRLTIKRKIESLIEAAQPVRPAPRRGELFA